MLLDLSNSIRTQHQAALLRLAALNELRGKESSRMKMQKLYHSCLKAIKNCIEDENTPSEVEFKDALDFFIDLQVFSVE